MLELTNYSAYEFLRPLVQGWLGKIRCALESPARKKWKEVADECLMLYSKSAAAMWDPAYSKKFWSNVKAPKFRITINKAFEYVAIFGPNLIWDCPHRAVNPKRRQDYPQELFQLMPNGQQLYEMLGQQDAQELAVSKAIAAVMQPWLNYTARETPGGGLVGHSLHAVTDSLIKGRGVLWSETYQFPASGRNLVGSFHDDPESLIVDPDFKTLHKARVIYRERCWPHWQVERHFGLPPGSLKGKATLESAYSYGEYHGNDDHGNPDRAAGKTNDLVKFYEVYSKCGVGAMLTNMEEGIKQHLHKVTGDYVYLAICDKVPWPLNCPSEVLLKGATDAEVRKRFEWPTPFWTDDRWPMEVLDHYIDPDGPYPVPPLAPAMGELKLLNFLVPWTIQHAHRASKTFWAVAGAQVDHYKKYLDDIEDMGIVPTPSGVQDVRQAIMQFEQKQTTEDSWRVIEMLSTLVDKRTGLTEQAYGRNEDGTQNRTAQETAAKQRAVGVRSEHMQKQTKDWQSRVESQEAFLSRMFVTGEDVQPVLGSMGRYLWEQYVMSNNVELVARGMEYEVGAASIRRPDRERDIANYQQAIGIFAPVVQTYGESSGNYEPFNYLMKKWAEFHDADLDGAMIPGPTEEQQAQQQQQQQLANEQIMAEVEAKKAEAALKMAQAATAGNEQAAAQQELQLDAAKTQMELQAKEREGAMKMAETQAKVQATQQQTAIKLQGEKFKSVMELQKHRQQLLMDEERHDQELRQSQQQSELQLKQSKQQGQQQLQLNKQMANAKAKAAAKKPTPAKK